MLNLNELLICPTCAGELYLNDKSVGCDKCGTAFSVKDGVVNFISGEKLNTSAKRIGILHKIKMRIVHPVRNFPFSVLQKRRIKLLYEKYLNDMETALSFRKKYLPDEFHDKEGFVLDFGCGRGRYSAMLSQCGFDIVGIDQCSSNKDASLDYWNKIGKGRFMIGTNKDINFLRSGIFDISLCMQVLTYIDDDLGLIRDFNRLLKKDGYLILQVTNKDNLCTFIRKRGLIDEPIKRYYSLQVIRFKLEACGFLVKSMWTEKLYFPFFGEFLQFAIEALFPQRVDRFLSDITPPAWRGIINIVAQKR